MDVSAIVRALESGPSAAKAISMRAAVRLAPAQAKVQLSKLLNVSDDRVRLAAARQLVGLQEWSGVLETLLKLLESQNSEIRSRALSTLQALTGQHIPFAVDGSQEDRAAAVRAWRQWVDSHPSSAIQSLALSDQRAQLGKLLVVSPSLLVELDSNRKESSRLPLPGAAGGCQGLPNGNWLVAIHSHSMVLEYDSTGREIWRRDRLPAPPTSVQRLENGNTLVSCGNANQVVEVTPDGMVTAIDVPGIPIWAQRLESGNTLVALQEGLRVVEINSRGRVLAEIPTGIPPSHAVRLENGNTLVTLPQARKVVEYDAIGKAIVWSTGVPLINPCCAVRLWNGNTLVADHTGVQEFDASGRRVLRRYQQPQVVGLSSF